MNICGGNIKMEENNEKDEWASIGIKSSTKKLIEKFKEDNNIKSLELTDDNLIRIIFSCISPKKFSEKINEIKEQKEKLKELIPKELI